MSTKEAEHQEEEETKPSSLLSSEDSKNRLAAAEFDMHRIVDRSITCIHPDLKPSDLYKDMATKRGIVLSPFAGL